MPEEIELRAKSDRELLVMTVMQGNETVRHLELINSTLKNHEGRIHNLEGNPGILKVSKAKQAGLGGGIFVVGSLLGGVFYAFGQAIGWW